MKRILTILLVICALNSNAQESSRILLLNGFLHVGNGETMERSAITIENGKIKTIKNSLAFSYDKNDFDTVIDLKGSHVYPGFVAPNSTLGITEIDAVRATNDYHEVGFMNPHVRTQIAYNVESKVISTVRTNGVLISQPTPRGGRISGSSSVMKMDGWNWEDATISAEDGIHINWPASLQGGGWWAEPKPKEINKEYDTEKNKLYEFFDMAEAYAKGNKLENADLRLEAMIDCFKGEKRVYFHASELQQLLDVIEFSNHYKLKFPVIVGGYDAHLITPQLHDAKIPVMIERPHSLPELEDDDVDLPYKLAYLLYKGNVKFCIQNAGDMEAMNARNIPFLAGTAMSYGLTMEDAIQAVSLTPCEIMGIDKNYGSIEIGKSATLFVSEGNALDMRTNNVQLALIDGNFMSLENSQKTLFEKYQKKYDSQKTTN